MSEVIASKENATKALEKLRGQAEQLNSEVIWLDEFLQACEKRLPSQEAIDKDRKRKRKAA